MRIVIILLFSVLSFSARSFDTLRIQNNKHDYLLTPFIHFYVDSFRNNNVYLINQRLSKNYIKGSQKPISININKASLWGAFIVKNCTNEDINEVLYLTHNFFDSVVCYLVKDNEIQRAGVTGDMVRPANQTTSSRLSIFTFNLSKGQSLKIIFNCKENRKIVSHFKLLDHHTFIQKTDSDHILIGMYYGIMLLFAFTGIFVYFTTREKTLLFYGLFVFFGSMSSATANGTWHRFIFGSFPKISIVFHSLMVIGWIIMFVLFSMYFLRLKEHRLKNFMYLKYMVRCLLFISLVLLILNIVADFKELNIIMYLLIFIVDVMVIYSIIRMIRYERWRALLLLFSFIPLVVSFVLYALMRRGVFYDIFWVNNITVIASFSLAIVISLAIGITIRNNFKQRIQLLKDLAEQDRVFQLKMDEQRLNQQSELANVLHDSIGSKLKYVRGLIESREYNKAESEINVLGSEIRDLSHSMSPTILDHINLKEAIDDLVIKYSNNGLTIHFYSSDFDTISISKRIKTVLYNIIQEIIQNTLKHSNANNLHLNLHYLNDTLIFTSEDDGIGFDVKVPTEGIGIVSVKSRILNLRGNVEIDSHPGKGVFYAIEVPIIE